MDHAADTFNELRPRLQKIAYRMLGSVAEAEDVVQDAWLRWHGAAQQNIDNTEAWLVAVTTRLSIDQLRAAKRQRDHYPGIWLPEPQMSESPATPEEISERADDISMAYLMLLERLTPEARAAFLLHDVFDADYAQIAEALGKTQAACRQLVSRARTQLRTKQSRFTVPRETYHHLLRAFAQVLEQGDFAGINALLAEDAVLMGDGGGKVTSFPKPMVGGRRIAQLFLAAALRHKTALRMELVMLNQQWALLRFIQGQLESALMFDISGEHIQRIYVQRNPDKLARIAAASAGR
ncbi:RNA polymerase sigma-70 factor [Allopusillimonas ginsengisoli]|uniref:RNA polymerase sigma-70 factor n=1 Tax=Allopusillimonas ginsengisoli TaxID=453575 RepID=UPI00101F1CDF|nr:RNA polymerase sigma-70 factor [Allopusillimonas ginsengisoli]TEA77175.1 RNA polymerase sigma-70 factor [Allopusillimonas ginsengisoli]